MNKLRYLEIFIKVAEIGSFHAVSKVLGISPQATSKAISQLERSIGIKLFRRNTRQCRLTEEGQGFLNKVQSGVKILDEAWNSAKASYSDLSGTIRITASTNMAGKIIVPLIKTFQEINPKLDFNLITTDQFVDLVKEGIDIGFRTGLEPGGKHHSIKLNSIQLITCASPEYLNNNGMPISVQELSHHKCLGFEFPNSGRVEPWEFIKNEQLFFQNVNSFFHTNDADTKAKAVLLGMGIGQLTNLAAAEGLRSGKLVPVFYDNVSYRYGEYMYYPGHHDLTTRARKFVNFVTNQLVNNDNNLFSSAELKRLQDVFLKGA